MKLIKINDSGLYSLFLVILRKGTQKHRWNQIKRNSVREFYSSFPNTKRENPIKRTAMRFHVDNRIIFHEIKKVKQCYSTSLGLKALTILWTKEVPALNQQRQYFGSINFQALGLKPAFSKTRSHKHVVRPEVTQAWSRRQPQVCSVQDSYMLLWKLLLLRWSLPTAEQAHEYFVQYCSWPTPPGL